MTEPADDIAVGVVLVVAQCEPHRERSEDLDKRLTAGLDWELDQLVASAAKGKRCERIWKDGPP